jgi:hypothetical protein
MGFNKKDIETRWKVKLVKDQGVGFNGKYHYWNIFNEDMSDCISEQYTLKDCVDFLRDYSNNNITE